MICVDASVALKWLLREEYSSEARALLRTQLERQQAIVAPPLLAMEVTNILRQRIRARTLTHQQAESRLARFLALPISFLAPAGIYSRALTIAVTHNLPAIYDPLYLALAESEGTALWTSDGKLIRAVGQAFPLLHWIGDYRPEADDLTV